MKFKIQEEQFGGDRSRNGCEPEGDGQGENDWDGAQRAFWAGGRECSLFCSGWCYSVYKKVTELYTGERYTLYYIYVILN